MVHNLTQNLSSTIKTKLTKVLSIDFRGKKLDKKKIKEKYEKYLKDHGATNNGLIVLFAYLFMRLEKASTLQFEQLNKEICHFLDKIERNYVNT